MSVVSRRILAAAVLLWTFALPAQPMPAPAEFRLLRYFMLHPGQLLSKSHLAEHLYDGETERDSNVLEVHVNRLRGKLGREVIETRRGQGYRFSGVSG